ncbi:tetratricopeptide repeat protein [Marinomonas dokdonensis]|uniref:tetratricopeptide repeat protein n=1 Tax=Marinomonas dokdonensis TaxID=328224 RepID=UPI004055673C
MTILFPHLPKTAGQTLVKNIKMYKSVGDDFYHLAPNGRIRDNLNKQLELNSSYNGFVIFGHNVDEGLLLKVSDPNVSLHTSLRSPLDRVISSYNMKVKAFPELGDDSKLEKYVSKRHSFICKWYCALFPSFISNPFDSCVDQAIYILEHFSDIYFQENIDIDYERFMNQIGGSFDASVSRNRAGSSYKQVAHSEEFSSFKPLLNNDYILYDYFKGEKHAKRNEFPEILSYHKWYDSIFNVLQQVKGVLNKEALNPYKKIDIDRFIGTIKESTQDDLILSSIISEDEPFFKNEFLLSIDDLDSIDSMNIFDIFKYIPFNKIKSTIAKSPLSKIVLDASKSESNESFLDVESDAWLDVCSRHPLVALKKSRIYEKSGDFIEAEKQLLKLCKLAPHQERSFISLAKFYKKHGDNEDSFRKCVDKILDLDPDNKWANKNIR